MMWKRLKQFVAGEQSPYKAAETDVKLTLTDPDVIAGFKDIAVGLRHRKPVCPVATGGVILLDPADIEAAFTNRRLSNQPSRFSALAPHNIDKYTAASVASHILPFLDGAQHVKLRQWTSQAFFRSLKDFEPQIEPIVSAYCQNLTSDQPLPLVEQVARDVIVKITGRFIGVDLTPEQMKEFTTALFRLFAPAQTAETFRLTNEGLDHARESLAQVLQDQRAAAKPCLLTSLDETFPADLDPDDKDHLIIDNALLFMADGVENVEAAVAVVMMRYAEHPSEITSSFVRAALFEDTPGQTIARIASEDMLIGDEAVKAGAPVFLSLASGNDASSEGVEFTFGRGRHKCLGENFAVSIVTAVCRELALRQPLLDTRNLKYKTMLGHKWPRGIAVTLTR